MFKAGTVTGLTSAQMLVQDTQKDVKKEGTSDHKERNSTARSARKLNGAHHGVSPRGQTTSRNPNFALFTLIFNIFFDSV
jgi:hypothetical protein